MSARKRVHATEEAEKLVERCCCPWDFPLHPFPWNKEGPNLDTAILSQPA